MIYNYFIIAWRNLKNNIFFSVLNIVGLSIGMAACLIMSLFAFDQHSYDKHHQKADRIYRVVNRQQDGNKLSYVAVTQGVLAPELVKTFPEIEAATRAGFMRTSLSTEGKDEAVEANVLAVDTAFFSIFDIPFVQRPKGEILSREDILISETASVRLFGEKNPLGEIISLGENIQVTVTGVFRDFPIQTHIASDYILSFSWIEKTEPQTLAWEINAWYNYVLMPSQFDKPSFEKKLDAYIHRFTPSSWTRIEYFLQPLRVINLQAGYVSNPKGTVGKITINGFIMVAVIVLLLASFNYMNLATARSIGRSMEVGIRKVVGAHRAQLISQFLIESFVLCIFGFLLAVLLADVGIGFFNSYTGFSITLASFFGSAEVCLWMAGALLIIGLTSGGYPAFFLSHFLPVAVLKGKQAKDTSQWLRKGLVVFQFSLTTILVVLVVIVQKQTSYMRNFDLGFNKHQLMVFSAERNKNIGVEAFKSELLNVPGVVHVASSSHFPGTRLSATNIWETGNSKDESIKALWTYADHDYIETLELRLLAGRDFNRNGTDKAGIIINENATSAFGWKPEEAIGKRISGFTFSDSLPGEVVGVIKDFHISPLRKEIMPLLIVYNPDQTSYLLRLQSDIMLQTRAQVDKVATPFLTGQYESYFMTEMLEMSYGVETKTGEVLTFFTLLAILIGCSGLYALATYEGQQRIKELGIRKIMGASSPQLLALLSKKVITLICLSLLIALPLAFFVGSVWLRVYPYRISWSTDIFLITSLLILLLGWLTTAWQAIKATQLNPVEALRHE